MNKTDVLKMLESQSSSIKSTRTAAIGNTKTYGIGLTVLRKLAKTIGKDHKLALELWATDIYELRILGLLIDDPKMITREQAASQLDEFDEPLYPHVFSACGSPLSKVPFVVELATDWIDSKEKLRRECGYGLLSEIASSKKKNAPDDKFFLAYVDRIHQGFKKHGIVEGAYALLCIGKRNKDLNAAALKVAKEIGPIELDSDSGTCQPFDLVDHLTKDHLKQRLGIPND